MNLEPFIQSEVKSEREKLINAYLWNLEKCYWWTHLQSRNRDADTENRFVDTAGKGEGGINWKRGTETYT